PPFTFAAITGPAPAAARTLVSDRAATENPFCNAGIELGNRGDADYLDLDPIRSPVDHLNQNGARFGLEQVGELVPAFGGNNSVALCTLMNGGAPIQPRDHSTIAGRNRGPIGGIGNLPNKAALQRDLGLDPTSEVPLAMPYDPGSRLCLGVVLPIAIPAATS